MNLCRISTGTLEAAAKRTEALNTLLKYADITHAEWWDAKCGLRDLLTEAAEEQL